MNRLAPRVLAALAVLLSSAPAALAACDPTVSASPVIVGYFPSWGIYGRDFHVPDIDANKVTHVNYAFANIDGASGMAVLGDPWADVDVSYPGDCAGAGCLRGSFHQLELLKQAHPHLKVMISIGGWTWSEHFSAIASTAASRQRFVQSAIDLFIRGRFGGSFGDHPGIFDGLDIDWEHPVGGGMYPGRPEDRANYTLLMQEFRAQLDALEIVTGKQYELSIAVGAGASHLANLDLPGLAASVDHVLLMSYDYHGTWEATTNFNAPLHASSTDPSGSPADLCVEGSVRNALAAGCPANRLVVGIPFYGRSWTGVGSANDGLYQGASGAGPGTFEPGMLDYWDIAARLLPTMPRFMHPEAGVPWLYSAGTFVTLDDPEAVAAKAAFIAEQGLAGAMAWELSGDVRGLPSPPNSLLSALVASLCPDVVVPGAIRDLRVTREGDDLLFTWSLDADARGGYHLYQTDARSQSGSLRDTLPGVDPFLATPADPTFPVRFVSGVTLGLTYYQALGVASDGLSEGPN